MQLPALENLLARGVFTSPAHAAGPVQPGEAMCLENRLCELFGQPHPEGRQTDAPIAAISARFDRLGEGCWLRADPVYLHLDQNRMLLSSVTPSAGDARAMCASLNEHFAGQGMAFFAPHPQRWYLRTEALPRIRTIPMSQMMGANVGDALPAGGEAARWHGIFNEIQMLLYSHPVNGAREARGELPVNSVWLWGGGCTAEVLLQRNFDSVSSDEVMAEMFAAESAVPFEPWHAQWQGRQGHQLLVWSGLNAALQRGDLAGWRAALQDFERSHAQPLWRALRAGGIARLEIEAWGNGNDLSARLSRGDAWAFWRRARPLERYSMV